MVLSQILVGALRILDICAIPQLVELSKGLSMISFKGAYYPKSVIMYAVYFYGFVAQIG
ncbi:MAG: hypothetical protein AB8B71_12310 [Paracoccaceae bacterium]